MIDTLEVIDTFDADTAEVGDLIRISYGENTDILTVTTVDHDYDAERPELIEIVGVSEHEGDLVEYIVPFDTIVQLLGEPVEDI